MILTKELLQSANACTEGFKFGLDNNLINGDYDSAVQFCNDNGQPEFGGWLTDVKNTIEVWRTAGLTFTEHQYRFFNFGTNTFQIFESKAYGASVILLIAACLKATQTQILAATAKELGMEVLLELHDETELGHICDEVDMVGINNRSLKSFEVDIQHSLTLNNQLPPGKLSIAESGIYSVETYQLLKEKGFNGFLMGEYFMKKENPALEFEQFTKAIKTT